jgi:hypothetical protein
MTSPPPESEPLDSDEQAALDLHEAKAFPLADHGRSPARRDVPQVRPIHDVFHHALTPKEPPMAVRHVYLDTEFLPIDPTNRGLVSIGLTDGQGRSYYAVNRDMDVEALLSAPWMVNNVVPHLPVEKEPDSGGWIGMLDFDHPDMKPLQTIRDEVTAYFAGTEASETRLYAYYGGQDIGRLHMLWDNDWARMPAFIPQWFTELQALIVDAGNPRLPEQPKGLHHALADAEHNRRIHERLMSLGRERAA